MHPFSWPKSLHDHVAAVPDAFRTDGLPGARRAVSMIAGRETGQLDEAGVSCRYRDDGGEFFRRRRGSVFWYLVGLPGLFAYKALNTADSMIGHKNERYLMFGRASARLDDLANLVPARASAMLIWAAAFMLPGADARSSFRATLRDARLHRSPNAGWPEAAMAGALGLRLAGPRVYDGAIVEDAWMGAGGGTAGMGDVRRALAVFRLACGALILLTGFFAFAA